MSNLQGVDVVLNGEAARAANSEESLDNGPALPPPSIVNEKEIALPRARRAAPRVPSGVPVSVFGAVPIRASAWGIKRRNSVGHWDVLSHGESNVRRQEWPISELSEETVRARWGAGHYRVQWFEVTANGGRRFMCLGREVEFEDAHTPAPAPAFVPSSGGAAVSDPLGPLTDAMRVIDLIEARADGKIEGMARLAQIIGGGNRGISGEDLVRVLREERQSYAESTRAAIAAAVEPLQRQLAEFGGEDDDDDSPGIADAARAAAPLIKGKGTLASVLNFASANPKIVEGALPIIAGAFSALAAVVQKASTPPAPAPAPPPAPALPRAAPSAAPPAPPVQEMGGSLSAWKSDEKKAEVVEASPAS